MFGVNDPIPRGTWAVVPAMFTKPPGIFPRAYVSTCSVIGPLTFFKHLQNSEHCLTKCSNDCFSVLDHASFIFNGKTYT